MAESTSRPLKRQRNAEDLGFVPDDKFWLQDGNLILVSTEQRAFRVHLGLLAMHCQFFKDMAENADADDTGTTTLHLSDSESDIKWLLNYLYTPCFFLPGTLTPFEQLSGMLRVSTKYLCDQLRNAVIEHLILIYPADRASLNKPPPLIPSENTRNHSLLALEMGRMNDVPQILPLAFYHATGLDPASLRDVYPSLSPDDERMILLGRARLSEAVVQKAWGWLHQGAPLGCQYPPCLSARCKCLAHAICVIPLFTPQIFNHPTLHQSLCTGNSVFSLNAFQSVHTIMGPICNSCSSKWTDIETRGYETVWRELPSYFDLQWTPSV